MSLGQTIGMALLCALAALILKESKSAMAPLVLLVGGLALLLAFLPRLSAFSAFFTLLEENGLGEETKTAVRILAVGFLASLGAEACAELGAPSLASKVDFCGKLEILLIALPTLTALLREAMSLLA